jgi:hypothetical protein
MRVYIFGVSTRNEEEPVKKSRNSVEGEDHDEDEVVWRQGK